MAPLSRLAVLTALLLAPLAWGETPNPDLPRALQLLDELRYAEASRALESARAQPGNDHETLLKILELQGVVAAMLQQPAKALAAFQALLVLDPDHQLIGDYAPRVVTPFFEAKGWVADTGAVLRLEAAPADQGAASIERISVRLTADPLKLAHMVRFHVRADGAAWDTRDSPLAEGAASTEVKGLRVEWWAELLDERQAVLATVGSDASPVVETASGPLALTARDGTGVKSSPSSPMRTAAKVCLAVAVGSGAAGTYFGLRSHSARAELESAPVDEQGLTVGLTQREAYALDERARSSARLANVLFGVAGATAIAGGTLWVLGAPVTVTATPAGVSVGGTLP